MAAVAEQPGVALVNAAENLDLEIALFDCLRVYTSICQNEHEDFSRFVDGVVNGGGVVWLRTIQGRAQQWNGHTCQEPPPA